MDEYTKTINMGNGENTVNLSGLGTTTIVSGVDDDTINIDGSANSSLTKTTIKAGKGTNTININVANSFGTVTLAEEKVGATNIINFNQGLGGEYQLQKDGNDLVIVSGAVETSSLRIVGYYATDAVKTKNKYANIQFQLNGSNAEYADLLTAVGGHTTIRGKGTIVGTADSDEIIADDHSNLKLKASNDVIKAGKGDDRINAGKGKNTIYYYDGDGNDTIEVGEGTDTLVFANAKSFNDLEFEYGDSSNMDFNLYIRYGDNTITLEMFQKWGTSVQYIKVGNKTRAISSFAPKMVGTDGNDTFTSTVFNDTIEGKGGTNTVIYQGGSFGNDVINLTEGENLVLDFTAYEDLWGSGAITRSVVGDDLVVTMKGWDDNGKRVTHGTVTLKGFGKENVVGEGSVILKLPDDEQMDLNTAEWDVNVTSNYTGNRFDEYIDAYSAKKAITITGGKGDDYIESSHYKATTFVFNEGDGNDIITNTKVNDIIKMNYTGEINYVNNGNDLIIEYGDGDTLQVSDYFVTDKKERIDKIQIKTAKGYETKSLAELTHIADVEKTTLNVRINDGEIVLKPDTQYTTINFVGMNTLTHLEVLDNLWEGKNTDDLYIAYGNSGDVIILKDYVKTKGVHNLKQFKVDGGVYDLPQRYYSGDNNSIESSPMKEHIYLDGGNHTINFGMTDHFGNRYDYVYSQKEQNTDTDTMKLTDYSFEDGELSAYRTATVSLGGETAYGSIVLSANNSEGRSNYVQYVDAFSGKTPHLQIQDKNGIIRVDQLAAAGNLNWNTTEEADKNHIAFLYGTEGNDVKNNVVSNEKRNYINTYDNAALNYTYNGGHDIIQSMANTGTYGTDDIYNVNSFTANSKLSVLDNGGLNDAVNINVAGMTSDDFYLLCDIGCDYDSAPSPDAWATALVHKDALTLDTLRAYFDDDTYNASNDTQQNNAVAGVLKFNGATTSVYDEFLDNWDSYTAIEHLKVNGSEDIDIAAWKKYIGGKVNNWLNNTDTPKGNLLFYYHSPSAVLRAIEEGELELTDEQLNGLLDCFKVKYSEVPKTTIFSSENSDVTTGDDTYNLGYAHNKITFDNQTIGKDTIVSPEKEYSASFRDKIVFAEGAGYSIANGTLDVQKDGDDLVIGKKGDLANNSVTYKNFMTDLTHNDTYIVDSAGDRYDLYVPTRGMGGVEDNSNNIVYAQIGEYGTQSISTSKSGRNFVYSYGEYNPEEYTYDKNLGMYQCVYSGAQDTVISYSDKANDNYQIWGFDDKAMLNVTDNGGANDTLEWGYRDPDHYTNAEMFDEARLVFDVDAGGIVFDDFMFVHEDKLNSTTLYNTTQQDLVAGVLRYNAAKSDVNSFGIEKVTLQNTDYTYSEINMNKWAYAIAKNVKAWLNDGTMNTAGYTSAYEAFANASHIDISGLVACYNIDYATVDLASTVLNITQGMDDFSISNYDGYETLNYSPGGVMDPNHLHYTKDGDDLIITVTDAYPTITLTDYYKGGHCVKQVDVANGNITYIPIRIGTNGDDTFETQYLQEEIYLKGGNDTVAFNGTNFYGVDQIFTEGTADNLTTMTFDSYSLNEDGLSFYAMFNDDYNRLDIHTSKQRVASYEYYFSDDKPTLQVWDKSHEGYFIDKNKTVVDADWTKDTQQWYNHVSFLMANGDNKIISNENTNLITASNGAKLDYTYNGGQDKVFAGSHADDSYTINSFNADTRLVIHDNGGDNNTLNFADANKGDIRLFFNVGQEKDHINEQTMELEYRDVISNEYAFIYNGQNGVFNAETLGNFVADTNNGYTSWIDGVLTFQMECYFDDHMDPAYGQFSTVSTMNGDIDFYSWKDQVTASVQSWLTSGANTQGYKTAFEAFENAADDGADISGLVAAYNVNYTQG